MFNKSLVSIYFTESKLFAIELSSNKKNVKKSVALHLPPGLIKNYRIVDKEALSKIIKRLWERTNFKEKSVGIVVPEFSTFTKLLKLPKISVSEINEAVEWQAQEYLPDSKENLISDWKVVRRDETGFEVLLVAIPKDILSTYVEVTEAAGLYPLLVATPSFSLTNLVSKETDGLLLIYMGLGETVLVFSIGEKILGTSVLSGVETEDLTEMSFKMINHYGKDVISKVFVGGRGISEELVGNLKAKLNKNIFPMKVNVKGLGEESLQDFLIPLSMQYGKIEEPADPGTLNLLPAGLVDKYKKAKMKVQVWSITLTITLFVWIPFMVVLGSFLTLSQQVASFKVTNERSIQITKQRENLESEIKKINEISSKVQKIKSATVLPQTVLNIIARVKSTNISITDYQMDLDKGVIKMGGISGDRTSLVNFSKSLEDSPEVSAVEIPISSFEEELNLEFEMTIYLRQEDSKPIPTSKIIKENYDE